MQEDGSTKREGYVFITTDERTDVEHDEKVNDSSQADAIYLAVNFAYLTLDKQKTINFDTSNG